MTRRDITLQPHYKPSLSKLSFMQVWTCMLSRQLEFACWTFLSCLFHGENYLQCNKVVWCRQSHLSFYASLFVQMLQIQIKWPYEAEVTKIMTSFKAFYELLLIYNAIDETNIRIVKPCVLLWLIVIVTNQEAITFNCKL